VQVDELKTYFQNLMFQYNKSEGKNTNKLIDIAINKGTKDFWGSAPWAFKERHTTKTTTASQETVDLPEDFQGLVSVVERETTRGQKLYKLVQDEYDRLIPDSAGQTEGTPDYYKVYFDDDRWKLALYPTPNDAMTLYITYHTLHSSQESPDKYIGGLVTTIGKFLFMPGSAAWFGAYNASLAEIERLKQVDNPDVEAISRMLDSSSDPIPWDFEEYVGGRRW
jgi:hypothetical protein